PRRPPTSTLFPYTTLFRSSPTHRSGAGRGGGPSAGKPTGCPGGGTEAPWAGRSCPWYKRGNTERFRPHRPQIQAPWPSPPPPAPRRRACPVRDLRRPPTATPNWAPDGAAALPPRQIRPTQRATRLRRGGWYRRDPPPTAGNRGYGSRRRASTGRSGAPDSGGC